VGDDRDPHLGVPAAFGLAGLATHPSCFFEDRERAVDLAALLVAADMSETSVRVTPAGRSLVAAQISSAVGSVVGSPRLSPKIQRAESAL
jgi:hypothetical protein